MNAPFETLMRRGGFRFLFQLLPTTTHYYQLIIYNSVMRIPFFSVCLSVCEQNKNCSCAKNVVVTRVVQIFISFISLNRRSCSTEMMCLHIYRRRESISNFFFSTKKNLWRFWQFIPRTHEPVFFESALYFLRSKFQRLKDLDDDTTKERGNPWWFWYFSTV